MENLNSLNKKDLVDLLSAHTSRYVQLHREGAREKDLQRCRLLLEALQMEIKSRR